MTPRWYRPTRYPTLVLIAGMAVCSVGFAWLTYGLLAVAMANADFLTMHWLLAAREGGLVQLLVIVTKVLVALFCYIGFKGIEHQVIYRWLDRSH
ncbi:MAG: hypothetical protein ACT4OK_07275 [Gemmobacter sp.]